MNYSSFVCLYALYARIAIIILHSNFETCQFRQLYGKNLDLQNKHDIERLAPRQQIFVTSIVMTFIGYNVFSIHSCINTALVGNLMLALAYIIYILEKIWFTNTTNN